MMKLKKIKSKVMLQRSKNDYFLKIKRFFLKKIAFLCQKMSFSVIRFTIKLFIYYMNKHRPALAYHSQLQDNSDGKGTVLQNTYIIYTPKIITFVYNSTQQNSQSFGIPEKSVYVPPQKQLSLELSRPESVKPRTTKIRLISRGTTDINSEKLDKSIEQSASKRQRAPQKRGLKVQSTSVKPKSDSIHIQVEPLLPTFSCGGCTDPNEDQHFERFPSHIQMRKTESRMIHLDIPKPQPTSTHIQLSKDLNGSINQAKQRKKIFSKRRFDDSKLNNSVDLLNSRSRKSIFRPYDARSHSVSLDLSFRKRRKIFKMAKLYHFHEEAIDQDHVPRCILESWKKYPNSPPRNSVSSIKIQEDT